MCHQHSERGPARFLLNTDSIGMNEQLDQSLQAWR